MKTISVGLSAHLANPVTTLATCWYIVRVDGQQYAFTTFDADLVIDGITYSSVAGFSRTAISTGSSGEVDNLNVVGFFNDEDGIAERDIKNGLLDYAEILVFCVNWANLTEGICRLRRGWLGECKLSPAGVFVAELRGLTQALVQEFGADYMPICRADLGDHQCKVPIAPPLWQPGEAINKGDYRRALTAPTDALLVAIFQAQGPGTTGAVEPSWTAGIGTTTSDHGIAWLSQPYWRAISSVASPISPRQFISFPFAVPAISGADTSLLTNAQIYFTAPVSAGTTIVVDDGNVSHSIGATENVSPDTAMFITMAYFNAQTGWGITVSRASSNVLNFSNASGQPGHIFKTGDSHGGVVIRDFMSPPFAGGHLTWISGANAGRSMEVKEFDGVSNKVTLWLGMYYPIATNDRFFIYPGCDKRRDTCFTTFHNMDNFRGEPDMPGLDRMLSYPDA